MTDPGVPNADEVRRAADVLVECYGAAALAQARILEELSSVPGFALAVRIEVERRF